MRNLSSLICYANEHDEASAVGSLDGSEGHRQQTGGFLQGIDFFFGGQVDEVEHHQSVRFLEDEAAAFVLAEFCGRINLLPLLHTDIVVIVAFHEWCTHSEIGDTLFGIVLGDAFPKTVNAFQADHQLVLPVDSSDGKLHIQANYMI